MVTGADGFIGSNLAKELISRRANVVTVLRDIKKENNIDLFGLRDKITIIHGDLIDFPDCERAINEYEIDTVFHLAAQAVVGVANRSPLSTFESNIKGTWNVLEACRLSKTVKRIVAASSDKAYGQQEKLPYTEESPLLGYYPYDASKACADILARSYFRTYGLPVAVTRNANTYGPGDMNASRLIPDIIKALLNDEAPIIRSDGTPERDYMYIKDAVEAYLVLAEKLHEKSVQGQAFNFGTGKPVSVMAVYKMIADTLGKDIKPRILGEARNEIDRQYLSSEKVRKVLAWQPRYTLEQGLKETIDWYRKFLKRE